MPKIPVENTTTTSSPFYPHPASATLFPVPIKQHIHSPIVLYQSKKRRAVVRSKQQKLWQNIRQSLVNRTERGLTGNGDHPAAEDTEQAEVLSEGKALYLEAEALRINQNRKEMPQLLPVSLKGKTGLAMGAAILLGDAGLNVRRFNPYGQPDTRPLDSTNAGSGIINCGTFDRTNNFVPESYPVWQRC